MSLGLLNVLLSASIEGMAVEVYANTVPIKKVLNNHTYFIPRYII